MSIIIIPPSVRVDLSPILISENSRESLKAPLYSVLDTDTEGVSFHPYFCTFPECLQKCINRAKPKAKSQKVGHEEEVLKTGTDTSEQLRGERTGIKSELDSGDGKVEVYVRLLWNELPPSSGRIAQHPCHREGHMEVCRQWRLLFETDMSRNEPEGRKSHRGSIFLSICFKFWFTKKHSPVL